MKKRHILIIAIIISIVFIGKCNSQENYFVSFGFDPKLAIDGAYSYDDTPVADIQFKTGVRKENGFEAGIQMEYAKLNPSYFSGGLFGNYVLENKMKTIQCSAGIEVIAITRGRYGELKNKKINTMWTYGLNSEIRFKIIDDIYIGLIANATHRIDLKYMYNEPVHFKMNGHVRFIYQWQISRRR